MIDKGNLEKFCINIKKHYSSYITDYKMIKSVWNEAGKLNVFMNDSRKDSILILETLSKYGIYDFPFWLQRDVLIPLFEKIASKWQKDRYLKKMQRGEIICALAITEESGGSDLNNINSKAHFFNEKYIISCKKNVVTNACFADLFFLVTKDLNNDLCIFLIEKDNVQMTIEKKDTVSYLNGFGIGSITCNSLKVSTKNKLGKSGAIKLSLIYSLAIERFCCASVTMKICQDMYEDITTWIKRRDVNRKYDSLWFELSDYSVAILQGQILYELVQNEFINRRNIFYLAAEMKYSMVKLGLNLSSSIARICGCYSIDKDSPINTIRYLNLIHAYAAAGGTQEVMLKIVSRYI